MFMKAPSGISGPNDDIVIPRGSKKTDWEVELGVIIGTKAKYVDEADALNHVAGYCTSHDVSEREFQLERGGTWDKGKCCDTFGPLGPWLVTRDEVPDPQNLALWLEVDGHRYQNGNTQTMIFPVKKLVSYLSQFMTLHPGDVITTGTPSRRRHGPEARENLPPPRPNRPPRSPRPRPATAAHRGRSIDRVEWPQNTKRGRGWQSPRSTTYHRAAYTLEAHGNALRSVNLTHQAQRYLMNSIS